MSDSLARKQISLFRSQVTNRKFDEQTLGILEALLVSKDVKSSLEVRSSLKELMRSESLSVLGGISNRSVEEKLWVLDFFVRAFALIGDFESCLALRYEALLLREFKSASRQCLKVSHVEWIKFAQHSLNNGFYSIAEKACENALFCLGNYGAADIKRDEAFDAEGVFPRAKRLKEIATVSAGSCSVKAEAAEYLKKKMTTKSDQSASVCYVKQAASSLFRDGIKKGNKRKLHKRQNLNLTARIQMRTEF